MDNKVLRYRIRYIKTLDEFNSQMSDGLISAGDIIFIEETGLIWTHSKLFGSEVNLDVVIENSLNSEDITKALSAYQGKVLDEKKVDKSDLTVALSTKADLDSDSKVPMNQLPSKVQKCAYYLGIWDAKENSPELNNQDKYDEGSYFVVRTEGERFGYKFRIQDIIIKANGTWIRLSGSTYYDKVEDRMIELERIINSMADILVNLNDRIEDLEEGGGGSGGDDPTLVDISIVSFTMDCDELNEVGSTINPTFNWSYSSENVSSQRFNDEPLEKSLRTTQVTDVKEDTTFKLTVTSLNTTSKTLNVKFVPRIYYGVSDAEEMTPGLVQSFVGDDVILDRKIGRTVFDCTGGKYVYYIVPTSDKDNVVIRDGNDFLFTGYTTQEVNITNTYGVQTSYTAFKTNNMYYSDEIIFKFE